jgi:serine/threonine-protein kinase
MGTPYYMSPEQCACAEVDARTDIYSLGVVLYELLTGTLPFTGRTPGDLMAAHIMLPPHPIDEALQVPQELERIVFRALAKGPSQRFQSMAELGSALRAAAVIIEQRSTTGSNPTAGASVTETALISSRKGPFRRYLVALIVASVVALVILATRAGN